MTHVNGQQCACRAAASQQTFAPGEVATYHTDALGRTHIDATRFNDRIAIERVPGRDGQWFKVAVNDQYLYLTRDQVKNLTIHAGSGDDRVRVGPGVPAGIRVYGGNGDDTLVSNSQGAFMDGGAGRDRIADRAGRCTLNGGPGADVIHPARGSSILHTDEQDRIRRPRRRRRPRRSSTPTAAALRPQGDRERITNVFERVGEKVKKFFRKLLPW